MSWTWLFMLIAVLGIWEGAQWRDLRLCESYIAILRQTAEREQAHRHEAQRLIFAHLPTTTPSERGTRLGLAPAQKRSHGRRSRRLKRWIPACARLDLPAALRAKDPKWRSLLANLLLELYGDSRLGDLALPERRNLIVELIATLRVNLARVTAAPSPIRIEPDVDWLGQLTPEDGLLGSIYRYMLVGDRTAPSLLSVLSVQTWWHTEARVPPRVQLQRCAPQLLAVLLGSEISRNVQERASQLMPAGEFEELVEECSRRAGSSLAECPHLEILSFTPKVRRGGDVVVRSSHHSQNWGAIHPHRVWPRTKRPKRNKTAKSRE